MASQIWLDEHNGFAFNPPCGYVDDDPVGADNPVTCAELRLQSHDVITSRVFASPSTHAWES